MIVLNDAQAMIIESLLTKMLINEAYSVSQLEEAIGWFQREHQKMSCPFEQVWAKNLAQEIAGLLKQP